MKIKDLAEESKWTQRPVDYIQVTKNIVESYPFGLIHGVQKDAIQNGWDAKLKHTKNFLEENWKFTFGLRYLPEIKKNVLIMSDQGTFGLTGNLSAEDVDDEYEELAEDERWARWESFAFAKGKGESLGARGQGKMIFFGGSKDFEIIYDSLRQDGTYRFGMTFAQKTGCPVCHYDEEEARNMIKKVGLDPIPYHGTRVIIMNPSEELINSIESGEFLFFIEETWWPIILKYNVDIRVMSNSEARNAKVPSYFPIETENDTDLFKTWTKSQATIKYWGEDYRIKTLRFACNKKEKIPEIHQGIACFRGGMKVATVNFPSRKYRENVYGYVEFDKKLDQALKEIEYPNHYGFRVHGLWRKVKEYVEEELEAFGNKKLGLGMDMKKEANVRRNTAENKALSVLRKITKNWALLIGSHGGGGGGDNGDSPLKEIGVRLSGLKFPNEGNLPRVDYGDSLRDFVPVIFNKTNHGIELLFTMYVFSGDRIIMELERRTVEVNPHSQIFPEGNYVIPINKEYFLEPGEYKLRLAITDEKKRRIDEVTRRFWIEMDPKLRAPFDVRKFDFPHELVDREWILEPKGDNKYTLVYNTLHSVYLHNDENEEKLSRYLSEIFCNGALQLLIKQLKAKKDEDKRKEDLPFDPEILFSDNTVEVYKEISKAVSSIRYQIHNII